MIGSVVSMWRYPVKSMQGEEVDEVVVTERGILGDRGYAVMERVTGYIASAKHPRKWSRLLECSAAFVESPGPEEPLPPVAITLPDGVVVRSDQPDADMILSRLLGRDVTLLAQAPAALRREADRSEPDRISPQEAIRVEEMALAAPAGTFFDYAALHLLTTATLNRLSDLHPSGQFVPARFRPNIVVTPTGEPRDFVENGWLGHKLTIGPEVRLHAIDPCPRCVITTLAQGDLPRDPVILRTLAQHNAVASATLAPGLVLPAVAGLYATVLRSGKICRGDAVGIVSEA
jgi:uncharacterized protein YcbX